MKSVAPASVNRLNVPALVMTVSFLLIHEYDGKWSLPILMWGLMGVFGAPPVQRVLCLLQLSSWLSLWFVVSTRYKQQGFLLPLSYLWITMLIPAAYQLGRPMNYESIWFWVPGILFIGSSLWVTRQLVFNWDDETK